MTIPEPKKESILADALTIKMAQGNCPELRAFFFTGGGRLEDFKCSEIEEKKLLFSAGRIKIKVEVGNYPTYNLIDCDYTID
jgi:hypothetical protein